MKKLLLMPIAIVFAIGAIDSFTLDALFHPVLHATHASGAITGIDTGISGARTYTPATQIDTGISGARTSTPTITPTTTRPTVTSPSSPSVRSPGISHGASRGTLRRRAPRKPQVEETQMTSSSGFDSAKTGSKQVNIYGKRVNEPGEKDYGDKNRFRKIEVIDADGKVFNGWEMQSGIENRLRINTRQGMEHVDISSISYIEFGDQELNRLEVFIRLTDGRTIQGTVNSRTSLEFIGESGTRVSRANTLSSISFKQE